MKYDLKAIMTRAWRIFRETAKKTAISFAEALHRAWQAAKAAPINAARIEEAKRAAGISEDCMTWAGWRDAGYEVQHGSRAAFQAELIWASRGDGVTYRASFFTASQVQPLAA